MLEHGLEGNIQSGLRRFFFFFFYFKFWISLFWRHGLIGECPILFWWVYQAFQFELDDNKIKKIKVPFMNSNLPIAKLKGLNVLDIAYLPLF